MAEGLKAADLKSVDVKASVGSNPTSSAIYEKWRSLVAHLVWDQRAAGSNPVFSTTFYAPIAQLVEREICNFDVVGSIPSGCSIYSRVIVGHAMCLISISTWVRFPPLLPFIPS